MKPSTLLLATTFGLGAAFGASAQQTQGQAHGGSHSGGVQQSTVDLPEACRAAAQAGGQSATVQDMQSRMQSQMHNMQGMMANMTETQKGLHEAMMKMDPAMMTGMMAKDPDVAWICVMIPHHQGAIDMARAGLKGADNAESKRLAEKTIRENEKSLAELKEWAGKHAKKEGNQ